MSIRSSNTSSSYQRISQNDSLNENERNKKKKADRIERMITKIHAMWWITLAIILILKTRIFLVTFYDERVNRWMLNISTILFVANFMIFLYLTFWLPIIQKITLPWEIYCPNLIPISTFLGVICFITINISLWPIYGLLTPLILVIILFGLLFSTHFIPWFC